MPPSAKEIGAVLGFSLDELELNRAGVVSSRQLWHVTSMAATVSLIGFAMTAFIVTLCALNWKTTSPAMKIMPVVFSVGALIFSGVTVRDALANFVTREVSSAEGHLVFQAVGRAQGMVVGAFQGLAPERARDVLTVGAVYRVYYLPHSNDFLSIEPIGPAEADAPRSP